MNIPSRWYVRYSLPVLYVGLGLGLRAALARFVGPDLPLFITFYPAVMLSALGGGVWPGILATLASALAAEYWFIAPVEAFRLLRPVDIAGLVLFNLMGVFISIVAGLFRNIPNRLERLVKERTKELKESEDRLRALYDSMAEGLANHEIVYKNGEAVDYIVTDVNPAYEKITGLDRVQAVGRKASELYGTGSPPYLDIYAKVALGSAPEYFETYFAPMEKHFAVSVFSPGTGKFATVFTDITYRKKAVEIEKDHSAELERYISEIKAANAGLNDSRKAALNLMDDALEAHRQAELTSAELRKEIAERERAQKELLHRTEDLAAANKDLESFAYSISHDLQGPLRAMKGLTSIVIEDYADKLDPEVQDYLKRIVSSSDKMSALIEDMLSLSKVSRQEINVQQINLSSIAMAIVDELRTSEPANNVEVTIVENLETRGDSRLMSIALSNLIGNAWKYSGKTPGAEIEFGGIEKDGKKVYYVRDNGAGFDMNFADRLFEPFKRLHTESEFPGTGIGLAIVKRVIEKHRGTIWARSEPGKGATFYFTLGPGTMVD